MSARLIVSSPVMTLSPLSPAFNFGIMDHSHSCRVYYEYYPQPLDQSSSFSTRRVCTKTNKSLRFLNWLPQIVPYGLLLTQEIIIDMQRDWSEIARPGWKH
ncbi:hypothetical protein P8452_38276 [Trifolium repens]|nr:hypothetical protein P8452_38276 [Trifolium repens]